MGCRGLIDDANLDAVEKIFEKEHLHGVMAAVAANCQGGAKRIYKAVEVFNGDIDTPRSRERNG